MGKTAPAPPGPATTNLEPLEHETDFYAVHPSGKIRVSRSTRSRAGRARPRRCSSRGGPIARRVAPPITPASHRGQALFNAYGILPRGSRLWAADWLLMLPRSANRPLMRRHRMPGWPHYCRPGFPWCGKHFSMLWKNGDCFFHSVENRGRFFSRCGKLFSTPWKTLVSAAPWRGSACAAARGTCVRGVCPGIPCRAPPPPDCRATCASSWIRPRSRSRKSA